MPTKQSRDGHRRSGQGVAAPALGKPIVKNFDPPRDPWLDGSGGSPSSAADTNWSQRMQQVMPDEDSYTGSDSDGDGSEETGDCGCDSNQICRCPKGSIIMDEQVLRVCIREIALHELNISDTAEQIVHLGLDACGVLFPGPGELCDLANVVLYAKKGEWLNAGFSLISVIPEIGDLIGKGGKYTKWVADTFPGAAKFTKKHAPKIAAAIRDIRTAIRSNRKLIDAILDRAEGDPRLAEYVPQIREALDAFAKERQISRVERDMKNFFDDVLDDLDFGIEETDVIDEDEDEDEEEAEIEEFSGAGGAGGGPALPVGMSTPSFGRKRRKKGSEVKGFKPTHG